jgi:hypothetical protein
MPFRAALFALVPVFALATTPAAAEDFATWPILMNPFPSTGGGGIMIDDYRPVIAGDLCLTNFTAIVDGQRFTNIAAFDAIPTQGGILCANGRWSAMDGSAAGTTPFRMFIKDGVVRRAP